jgi:hypothetical protein
MKRLIIIPVILFLFLISITSCQKESVATTLHDTVTVNPSPTVVGFWKGYIAIVGSPQTDPQAPFSYYFRSDGTFRVYDGNADTAASTHFDGTYHLSSLTLTYYYSTSLGPFIGQVTLNSSMDFFQGTLGQGASNSGFAINYAAKP